MNQSLGQKFRLFMKDFFERGDMFLLAVCMISSIYGMVAIGFAAQDMYEGNFLSSGGGHYILIQAVSMVIGIVAYVILTKLDTEILGSNWKILEIFNVLLLVALVIFGSDDGTGNKSWIRFGPIGIQPSEVIKIFFIVVFAYQLTYLRQYRDINGFLSIVQIVAHFGITFVGIVGVSSDLGSASIILLIFIVMFFGAGIKLYWIGLGGAAVAAVIPILWEFFLKGYQKERLVAPYDPTIDPTGYGITWQTTQSKLSLAYGRLTGVEEGTRLTVFTGKHTDFIFAAIGERFGMIGCIIVLILLTIIIARCMYTALHAGRTFDTLLCLGVTASVTCQLFVNVGMCMGITPVIGITLPFFSYGGSSMVTMFAAMGMVSSVHYKPKPSHPALIY